MKNLLRSIAIMLMVLALAAFSFTSCDDIFGTEDPHECESVCEKCGNCKDQNCSETACENKCECKEQPVIFSLVIEASKTEATRGETVTLTASLKSADSSENITDDVEFSIVSGAESASLSGNVLTIKATANHGDVIKIKAHEGATDSNVVEIVVNVPVTEITLSANGVTNVTAGNSVVIGTTVLPEGASKDVQLAITEGADSAMLSGNVLVVNANATTGTLIKVKAVSGSVESNELVFVVGYPLETITVVTTQTNVIAGQSAQLNVTIDPENATNGKYTWVFVEGGEYANVFNNLLTVNANAPTGAKIALKAVAGDVESNVVEFTVGYPLESITVTANATNVLSGNASPLNVVINPTNSTNAQYTWVFVEGGEYAYVVNNVLTVNANAPTGAKIVLKAVAGDIESNEVEITVGYPLESLTASVEGSANIRNGGSAELTVSLNPTNATNGQYVWEFVEGSEYARIVNGVIYINEDAPLNSIIKIVAVAGDIRSNEVVIIAGIPIETIVASSTAPEILDRGASYPLSVSVTPTGATANTIVWVVEEGEEYITITNNTLVVSVNTPAGTKVKLHAASGSVRSNDLEFTVGIPLESIEIALVGSANVDPGSTRSITHTLNPANASDTVLTWVIDDGAEYATLINGNIFIKDDAPIGAKVTFHAEIGDIKSNSLTVTVGTPIETITIEATGSLEVVKGNSVGLLATVTPSKASASLVSWVITEGSEYATVRGTTLVVNSDAKTGASIKVKAVWGDVESNELEFTVMATQEEINAAKLFLDLNTSTIRIDKKGTSAPVLTAEILNGNYETVVDMGVDFTVISGAELLGLTQDGYNCTFTALGHGEAIVEVRIVGTDVTETVTVDVIVPPESISLPEVFAERAGLEYAFSNVDPRTGATETLPFAPTVRGDALACTDLMFSFIHESGATGDSVATYADGAITFHKTGKVIVTVTSASGSRIEASTSYTFNINQGYNANSYAELSYIVESSFYTGSLPINLVVLEKPNGSATGYEYGYDIVPSIALLPQSEQTVAKLIRGFDTYNGKTVNYRIQAVNKGLWVNGNNHKLDVSQVKVYTMAEYEAYANAYGITSDDFMPNNSGFFTAETWYDKGPSDPNFKRASYQVRLYNLELKGNTPIDYDPTKYSSDPGALIGSYREGLSVGNYEYDTHYYIDANNITVSQFHTGMKFTNIVGNGKISNLYAYNCYSTGVVTRSSIVTLENLKFGPCGATGIELSPEDSAGAGLNNNEKSKITIAGTVDASTNLNSGNTNYFKYYDVGGATVPQIILGNTQLYTNEQVSHIMNSNGQFIFVSLVFNDLATLAPNESIVEYPAYQEGGIINIREINGIDTEHQFIEMDVMVTLPGLGTIKAGTAYFYNHNYIPQ